MTLRRTVTRRIQSLILLGAVMGTMLAGAQPVQADGAINLYGVYAYDKTYDNTTSASLDFSSAYLSGVDSGHQVFFD